MGIRNGGVVGHGVLRLGLITPHGDSERMTLAALTLATASHNPSWGFGTKLLAALLETQCHS